MPRVLRKNEGVDGEEHALGALLHDEPHNAACRAATPCYLYQR